MTAPDLVLALDAYSVGQSAGRLALVVAGAALLQTGLRRRRGSAAALPARVPVPVQPGPDRWTWMSAPAPAAVAAPSAPAVSPAQVATPPGFDGYFSSSSAPPPAPTAWPSLTPSPSPASSRTAGLPSVLVGGALIAVALVSLLAQWTPLGDARVDLPPQLLGMPKDDAASAMAQGAVDGMAAHLPGGTPENMQLAVYGTLPQAMVVVAADEGSRSPEADLMSPPGAMTSQFALDGGTSVDAGERGVAGRCWTGQQEGRPLVLCGFIDRETMLIVIDFTGNDLTTSTRAALAVREAVVV